MVSNEEENFLRIVYLNYRVATGALKRFFDIQHPNLSVDLHKPGIEASLKLLYKPPPGKKRVLYQGQWDILYPPPGKRLFFKLVICIIKYSFFSRKVKSSANFSSLSSKWHSMYF